MSQLILSLILNEKDEDRHLSHHVHSLLFQISNYYEIVQIDDKLNYKNI